MSQGGIRSLFVDGSAPPDRWAIVGRDGAVRWGEMGDRHRAAVRSLSSLEGHRVGVAIRSIPDSLATLAALDALRADAFLLDGGSGREEWKALADELRLAAVVDPADGAFEIIRRPRSAAGSGESTVTILTSGSTGRPKAARHTWASLSRPVRRSQDDSPPVWLLAYRLHLYAGLQVMLQCMLNRGTLVVADAGCSPDETLRLIRDQGVEYASATPSYWRRLLLLASPALRDGVRLRQITLGGEVCDQALLDGLKEAFPSARQVHIYATTELGRCFSVTDGRAGFPASFLDVPSPDGVSLKVEAGELRVRSANAMSAYDPLAPGAADWGEWFATGDLVERRGDRCHFVGRRTEIINVGGQKVHPVEVERILRDVPGVGDVRVFPHASSIAGELVACEVVPRAGEDPETVRTAVVERCNRELTAAQRPRIIRLVERISLSDAGKTLRRETS